MNNRSREPPGEKRKPGVEQVLITKKLKANEKNSYN